MPSMFFLCVSFASQATAAAKQNHKKKPGNHFSQ
jgi:hypothetical protein